MREDSTETLRNETIRLLGAASADERTQGLQAGAMLLARTTGYEHPAGLAAGDVRISNDGRAEVAVTASRIAGDPTAQRAVASVTMLPVDTAAPLLGAKELHKQLRRAVRKASNRGDAAAVKGLLATMSRWIPVPADGDRELPWRPTPAMWEQAPDAAARYHARRATALNAAAADAKGLYLLRHDETAGAAECTTGAAAPTGADAIVNLCHNCPPDELGQKPHGILEATVKGSETTAWPRFTPCHVFGGPVAEGPMLASRGDAEQTRIIVTLAGGHEHDVNRLAPLLDPRSVKAALTQLTLRSLDEQEDNGAESAIAAATRWTAITNPGRPPKSEDYEAPAGLAPAVEISTWQCALDTALHVARRLERHGRYLKQRRSNYELMCLGVHTV